MNCLQSENLIQEALDGALTARERAVLDAHLTVCADCRAAWDDYRNLTRTATAWTRSPIPAADPGEAFTAQVMAQIEARASEPASLWRQWIWASLTAAALIACALLLFPFTSVPLPSPEAVLGLPAWLGATASALPTTTARLWNSLTGGLTVSAAMVGLLSGALLANGLLYARIVCGARRSPAR